MLPTWIATYTGKVFHPLCDGDTPLDIRDIAHALSNLCRFGGHTKLFYSVAEHSVLVSRLCPPEDKLWGLLHDATEAYLVDVPAPVKNMLPAYVAAENLLAQRVADNWGLSWPMPQSVLHADRVALAVEMRYAMVPCSRPLGEGLPDLPNLEFPQFLPCDVAESLFLNRFAMLHKGI